MMRVLAVLFVAILCLLVLIPYAGDIGRYLAAWLRGQREPFNHDKQVETKEPESKEAESNEPETKP